MINNNLVGTKKTHFKMYKSKHGWLIAGVTMFAMLGVAMSQPTVARAADNDSVPAAQLQPESNQPGNQVNEPAEQTPADQIGQSTDGVTAEKAAPVNAVEKPAVTPTANEPAPEESQPAPETPKPVPAAASDASTPAPTPAPESPATSYVVTDGIGATVSQGRLEATDPTDPTEFAKSHVTDGYTVLSAVNADGVITVKTYKNDTVQTRDVVLGYTILNPSYPFQSPANNLPKAKIGSLSIVQTGTDDNGKPIYQSVGADAAQTFTIPDAPKGYQNVNFSPNFANYPDAPADDENGVHLGQSWTGMSNNFALATTGNITGQTIKFSADGSMIATNAKDMTIPSNGSIYHINKPETSWMYSLNTSSIYGFVALTSDADGKNYAPLFVNKDGQYEIDVGVEPESTRLTVHSNIPDFTVDLTDPATVIALANGSGINIPVPVGYRLVTGAVLKEDGTVVQTTNMMQAMIGEDGQYYSTDTYIEYAPLPITVNVEYQDTTGNVLRTSTWPALFDTPTSDYQPVLTASEQAAGAFVQSVTTNTTSENNVVERTITIVVATPTPAGTGNNGGYPYDGGQTTPATIATTDTTVTPNTDTNADDGTTPTTRQTGLPETGGSLPSNNEGKAGQRAQAVAMVHKNKQARDASNQPTGNRRNLASTNATANSGLPQTGDSQHTATTLFGMILLAMSGLLARLAYRRKNES